MFQNQAHVDITTVSFRDIYSSTTKLFKSHTYTIESINLYKTCQSDRKNLEIFFLTLLDQATQCSWAIDNEKEAVRDKFFAKMRFKNIQRDLCIRPAKSLRKTFKSALRQKKG